MKKTAFMAILCGALAIVSCKKADDNSDNKIIPDVEKEYTELYALGASVNKWDSMDPEPMKKVGKNLFEIEVDLIKSNENKLITRTSLSSSAPPRVLTGARLTISYPPVLRLTSLTVS